MPPLPGRTGPRRMWEDIKETYQSEKDTPGSASGVWWENVGDKSAGDTLSVSLAKRQLRSESAGANDARIHSEWFTSGRSVLFDGVLNAAKVVDVDPEEEEAAPKAVIVETNEEMPVLDIAKLPAELSRAEMEFSWELYLEEMNAYPVPRVAFPHIAQCLQNGLKEGQFLEYAYPPESSKVQQAKKSFWYLELLYARSNEVFVRYAALEDYPDEAFWIDLRTANVAVCGGFDKDVYRTNPPKAVQKHKAYFGNVMENARRGLPTPSAADLEVRGVALKDRVEEGQFLEVLDNERGLTTWPAVVKKNVGGRLELEYWKCDGESIWIFCTELRLRPIGYGRSSSGFMFGRAGDFKFKYEPPKGITLDSDVIEEVISFIDDFATSKKHTAVPASVFPSLDSAVPQLELRKGDHVELLHPKNYHQIFPAVVTEVHPDRTVSIQVLDYRPEGKREEVVKVCSALSLDVLPIHWCKKNGVRLSRPPGWKSDDGDFSWQKIVDNYGGTLALQKSFTHLNSLENPGFSRGMKLEVSNPSEPEEICTATVVKVIPPLLWVHIDSYGQSSTHILTFDSTEMFSVGFCGGNDYPLKMPRLITHGRRMATIRSRSHSSLSPSKASSPRATSEPDSPNPKTEKTKEKLSSAGAEMVTVYINPKCNCGPLMSLKKIISLPKSIGPGPVQLVLQCTITALIGCGTRPTKLLQLISASGESPRSANWERVRIKAKIGGRRQMCMIDVVKNAAQVSDFLRNTCILYEACPNLITVEPAAGRCGERCHQFIKPDTKNIQIRRRIPRNNTKDSLNDEVESSADTSMIEGLGDMDLDGEQVRMTVGGGDYDEDTEQGGSQTGFEDFPELDSLMIPMTPLNASRAPSVESDDNVPNSRRSSKRGAPDSEPLPKVHDVPLRPLKKKPRRGPPYAKSELGLRVPLATVAPVELDEEASSSSSEGSPEKEGAVAAAANRLLATVGQALAAENTQSMETQSSENQGELVDDSEYLLRFHKHPRTWTTEETYAFLRRQLPGSEAPDILREESVDGDALLMMCASDFRYLNIGDTDVMFIATLLERVIVSIMLTKGEPVPLYSKWK